jgi:hypothetical protein
MRDAVLRDGTTHFLAGLAGADRPRNRMRDDARIDAAAGHTADGTGSSKLRWKRHPGRALEDVLQRPSLLDEDREVCLGQPQREARGRFQQRLANTFERVGVRGLLRGRRSAKQDEHARQPERNRTHLFLTISVPVWPVEDSR